MTERSTTMDLHLIEAIKYCAENEPRLFDSMVQTLHAGGLFERFDDASYFVESDAPGAELAIAVIVRWESP